MTVNIVDLSLYYQSYLKIHMEKVNKGEDCTMLAI